MSDLLSVNSDAKTVKGLKQGYLTGILYLSPANSSGRNVCPNATPGCIAACLNTAGRAGIPGSNIPAARLRKTREFFIDRAAFIEGLRADIARLTRRAWRSGLTPAVRLNGTSDIPWERVAPGLLSDFLGIQFYDYTKSPARAIAYASGQLPANYHLTFSLAETEQSKTDAAAVLAAGGTVAAVFSDSNFPTTYLGAPVVDGDSSDLRFLDPRGSVVALKAKGRARRDTSGFVISTGAA